MHCAEVIERGFALRIRGTLTVANQCDSRYWFNSIEETGFHFEARRISRLFNGHYSHPTNANRSSCIDTGFALGPIGCQWSIRIDSASFEAIERHGRLPDDGWWCPTLDLLSVMSYVCWFAFSPSDSLWLLLTVVGVRCHSIRLQSYIVYSILISWKNCIHFHSSFDWFYFSLCRLVIARCFRNAD